MNAKQFLNNAVCHTDQGLSGVAAEPHPLPGQTADVRVFARLGQPRTLQLGRCFFCYLPLACWAKTILSLVSSCFLIHFLVSPLHFFSLV